MKYGFLRTAAVSPALHVADCAYNTQQIIAAMRAQAVAGTKLLCLPEFTLTGYTCSDLFLQETLCRGAEEGLIQILDASIAPYKFHFITRLFVSPKKPKNAAM